MVARVTRSFLFFFLQCISELFCPVAPFRDGHRHSEFVIQIRRVAALNPSRVYRERSENGRIRNREIILNEKFTKTTGTMF